MVSCLDIDESNKEILRKTLQKFEKGLFGGGLGILRRCKSVHIKLKPGAIPYKSWYYNLPKAYIDVTIKEIQRNMVDIGVLRELLWHDDSPSVSTSFAVPKKNWRHKYCNRF